MRILLTSDWHMDSSVSGVFRFGEIEEYFRRLLVVIDEKRVDFLFHLGDFFNPSARNWSLYTSTLIEMVDELCCSRLESVVFIAGNHDVISNSLGCTVLSPLSKAFRRNSHVHIVEGPEFINLITSDDMLAVLALPYVYRHTEDPRFDVAVTKAKDRLASKLAVLGHYSIEGARFGSESVDMSRGGEHEIPLDEIKMLNPSLVANGHYHRAQIVNSGGVDVIIPGSPLRFNFGERDDKRKGYTLVDL